MNAEYIVGKTVYGETLRLVFEKNMTGQPAWTLHKDPASRRDEPVVISGLSEEAILKMAEAVKGA